VSTLHIPEFPIPDRAPRIVLARIFFRNFHVV